MNFDFPAFLVLATLITGLIWLIDSILWAPKRAAKVEAGREVEEPYMVELSKSFFPIVLIVLVIRSFVAEPFRIPSGSMMPTLLVGDFILVNKFAYGIRLPVLNKKVIELGKPERGDTIVFRYPEDTSIDYIKRVVGLPGDHIRYQNKMLYINGVLAEQRDIGRYIGTGGGARMTGAFHRQENLVGVEHDILVMGERPINDFQFTVPEHEYFVMGDNRDNSRDSRFWGTVKDNLLIGKAFFIWMNWDGEGDTLISWDRIGGGIK